MKLDNCRRSCGSLPRERAGGDPQMRARPPPLVHHGEVTGEIAQWIEKPLR